MKKMVNETVKRRQCPAWKLGKLITENTVNTEILLQPLNLTLI